MATQNVVKAMEMLSNSKISLARLLMDKVTQNSYLLESIVNCHCSAPAHHVGFIAHSDFEMPLRSTEKDKASQLSVSKSSKYRKRRASLVDLERGPSSNPLDVDDPPPTESRGRRKRVSGNNLSSLREELDSIGRHVDRIQVRMKRLRTLLQQPCSDS
jgi:hypothetical protein